MRGGIRGPGDERSQYKNSFYVSLIPPAFPDTSPFYRSNTVITHNRTENYLHSSVEQKKAEGQNGASRPILALCCLFNVHLGAAWLTSIPARGWESAPEQLNDSGMWMVDSLRNTHTQRHTPFFMLHCLGQDNIKGHRRCDGKKRKRGTSALTLGCDKRNHFTSEWCRCKNGLNPAIVMKAAQIQMWEAKWSKKSLPALSLRPPLTQPYIALLGKAIKPDE